MKEVFYASLLLCLFLSVGCSYETGNRNRRVSEKIESNEDNLIEDESSVNAHHGDNSDREKPNEAKIQYDLIGHKLSEGLENGYRPKDWSWLIEDGQIKNFKIEQVLVDNSQDYEVVASMVLQGAKYGSNVKVQICYSLDGERWEIAKLRSLGIRVISDKRYEDCLTYKIADDGWGGVTCLQVKNECEVPLAVGGRIMTEFNGWRMFSIIVEPFETKNVGGTLSGGSVSDYEVHFVVRP